MPEGSTIFSAYPEATIRYVDGQSQLTVRRIYQWDRGDIAGPVMSASSGPKDYIRNGIWDIFEKNPQVNRICLVRAGGSPFVLMRDDQNCWFDVAGKQVTKA